MKVSELVELLQTFDQEAKLYIAVGYDSSNYPMEDGYVSYDSLRNKVYVG